VTSEPSVLFALGALSSYLLFAAGWTLFGIASLRARVFPVAISGLIVIGGVAGYNALLAPGGIPLGVALTALGGWMLATRADRTSGVRAFMGRRPASAGRARDR